jgi:hypothetical protein
MISPKKGVLGKLRRVVKLLPLLVRYFEEQAEK